MRVFVICASLDPARVLGRMAVLLDAPPPLRCAGASARSVCRAEEDVGARAGAKGGRPGQQLGRRASRSQRGARVQRALVEELAALAGEAGAGGAGAGVARAAPVGRVLQSWLLAARTILCPGGGGGGGGTSTHASPPCEAGGQTHKCRPALWRTAWPDSWIAKQEEMTLNVIPNNLEKYMSIMMGKKLVFIDSFQFMNQSLDKLVNNIKEFPHLQSEFPNVLDGLALKERYISV